MQSFPQFTRCTLYGEFAWVREINFGGYGVGAIFLTLCFWLRRANVQDLLTLWLEVTVQNLITSFRRVTFPIYGSVCSKFFWTVTPETKLKKKATTLFS